MPRLFIGLDVPILAPLSRLIDELARLGSSVRPVRPDALHITLRFLGEVEAEHADAVSNAIDAAVAEGIHAGWLGPFDLELTHAGTFPGAEPGQGVGPPRVVFAAPDDPGPLPRLSALLDGHIDALGLPIPPRDLPLDTHITLARVKRRRTPVRRVNESIAQLVAEAHGAGLGSMRVKAVKLIESRLGAAGPDYTARHTCRLR
jgi:2'-5' RNA ligase